MRMKDLFKMQIPVQSSNKIMVTSYKKISQIFGHFQRKWRSHCNTRDRQSIRRNEAKHTVSSVQQDKILLHLKIKFLHYVDAIRLLSAWFVTRCEMLQNFLKAYKRSIFICLHAWRMDLLGLPRNAFSHYLH